MKHEPAVLDVRTMPDLARLAREVARDGRVLVLREAGTDLAVLSPAPPTQRRRAAKRARQADIDAALATFGTWTDLDADRLFRELDEARGDSSQPATL